MQSSNGGAIGQHCNHANRSCVIAASSVVVCKMGKEAWVSHYIVLFNSIFRE